MEKRKKQRYRNEKMRIETIKVLGLLHKREKQSDHRLAWFMFHEIYRMCSNIKNKEHTNAAVVLTIMSEHEESNKLNKELENSCDNDEKKSNPPVKKYHSF